MKLRIDALLHLGEEHRTFQKKFHEHQKVVKSWFDRNFASDKEFKVGDLVLKWDTPSELRGKHSKFQKLWLGPYLIDQKLVPSTSRLKTLDEKLELLLINGKVLKNLFS